MQTRISPLALRVFEELLQENQIDKQTLFPLVGSRGPETAVISSFIGRRALENSVKLIDGVRDGELRWLYTNCEFLMVPSSTEGSGLPVAANEYADLYTQLREEALKVIKERGKANSAAS